MNAALNVDNCCRDLIVFNDLAAMRLEQTKATDECVSWSEVGPGESSTVWFESDVFVSGYKDASVKGKSIWIWRVSDEIMKTMVIIYILKTEN